MAVNQTRRAARPHRPRLSPEARRVKWHFARLGAFGALVAALLLEGGFAFTNVGRYFHEQATNVVMFYPATERPTVENLGTGDVQLTLRWSSFNDLDLHCIDPNGQHIFFGNRQVPSGGRLDVDMNEGSPPWQSQGIENIYWPFRGAPQGEYRVLVHHYRRNGGPDNAPFRLRILHRGQVDSPTGVATYAATVPADWRWPIDPVNPAEPMEVFRFRVELPAPAAGQPLAHWLAVGIAGLWAGLMSAGLTLAILNGLNRWYETHRGHRLVSVNKQRGLALRATGWGLLHGVLAQAFFGLFALWMPFALEFWRVLAWLALSVCVGNRAGQLIPAHLPIAEARKGGIWGGTSGGLGFLCLMLSGVGALAFGADLIGRLAAALLIGGCIGWRVQLPVLQVDAPEIEARTEATQTAPDENPAQSPLMIPVADSVAALMPAAPDSSLAETDDAITEVPKVLPTEDDASDATESVPESRRNLDALEQMQVMRSRGGRYLTGRGLGGPRSGSGGRRVGPGRRRPPS